MIEGKPRATAASTARHGVDARESEDEDVDASDVIADDDARANSRSRDVRIVCVFALRVATRRKVRRLKRVVCY